MKKFNTTAVCIPSRHYMVDISDKVEEIRHLVDNGRYFTINRARQYGKTTTLIALKKVLAEDYIVLSLDFQSIDRDVFESGASFSQALARLILDLHEFEELSVPEDTLRALNEINTADISKVKMDDLFRVIKRWIKGADRPLVLIVDEVDSAANNQVFLDFLAQLRDGYIGREADGVPAFQSVILAGVTDIRHIRGKLRPDDDHKENSPWNIATDFDIDMSLSREGIQSMLDEYESDHHTGMDTGQIAALIHDYTNGYPFLVSRICQIIDEKLPEILFTSDPEGSERWTDAGVNEAVKILVAEKNTLFDSLVSKLRDYEHLRNQLRRILLQGDTVEYLPDDIAQEQLMMYGFIVNNHNTVAVANMIFEMRLYKYYIGESSFSEEVRNFALDSKPEFIKNGELDVRLILERFIESQKYIHKLNDEEAEQRFLESEGREKFLTYLSPIINGVGTYTIEEQTRSKKRMDVVIHYLGKRYIIELKIWHGERYNSKGEKQILDYLDYFDLTTGYMLSFSFNKNKTQGVREVHIGDKVLYEGIV